MLLNHDKNENFYLFIMVGIVLLAFFVRINGVSDFSLWADEGYSIYTSGNGDLGLMFERIVEDRHPPLYFFALSVWQNIGGGAILALRFLAIIGGVLATAIVYRLGTDWFSASVGLYSAIIYSLLDLSIHYTQEVRHYSWLLLFTVAITWIFLRYLRKQTRLYWMLYFLLTYTIMLTHYFGAFIMMIHVLFGLFLWQASLKQKLTLVSAWVGAAILYIPWILAVIPSLSRITVGVGGFPGSFETNAEGIRTVFTLLFDGQIALLAGAYLLGLWQILRERSHLLSRLLIVASGGGLIIFLFVFNIWRGVLSARMIVFVIPSLVVIIAYGLSTLATVPRRLLLSILITLMFAMPRPIITPRPDAINASNYLSDAIREDDIVILELGWNDLALQYHLQQDLPVADTQIVSTVFWWEPENIIHETSEIINNGQSVWVLQWLHAPVILPRLQDGWFGFRSVFADTISNTDSPELYSPEEPILDPINVQLFLNPDLDEPVQIYGSQIQLDDLMVQNRGEAGELIPVDLWWSRVDDLILLDYSVVVYLVNEQQEVVAQVDMPIADIASTQWILGEYYHRRVMMELPDLAGQYTLQVTVYHYTTPNEPLSQDMDVSGLAEVVIE